MNGYYCANEDLVGSIVRVSRRTLKNAARSLFIGLTTTWAAEPPSLYCRSGVKAFVLPTKTEGVVAL
jgi:hypothetical protein